MVRSALLGSEYRDETGAVMTAEQLASSLGAEQLTAVLAEQVKLRISDDDEHGRAANGVTSPREENNMAPLDVLGPFLAVGAGQYSDFWDLVVHYVEEDGEKTNRNKIRFFFWVDHAAAALTFNGNLPSWEEWRKFFDKLSDADWQILNESRRGFFVKFLLGVFGPLAENIWDIGSSSTQERVLYSLLGFCNALFERGEFCCFRWGAEEESCSSSRSGELKPLGGQDFSSLVPPGCYLSGVDIDDITCWDEESAAQFWESAIRPAFLQTTVAEDDDDEIYRCELRPGGTLHLGKAATSVWKRFLQKIHKISDEHSDKRSDSEQNSERFFEECDEKLGRISEFLAAENHWRNAEERLEYEDAAYIGGEK